MKNNIYSEKRLQLIHEYNINLLTFIVDLFEEEFGQKMSHFEKLFICKKEDNVKSIVTFCELFRGTSNLEWVQIHFESGLYISMTAHAKILELRYKNPERQYMDHIRTSKINEIRNFLTEHKLI